MTSGMISVAIISTAAGAAKIDRMRLIDLTRVADRKTLIAETGPHRTSSTKDEPGRPLENTRRWARPARSPCDSRPLVRRPPRRELLQCASPIRERWRERQRRISRRPHFQDAGGKCVSLQDERRPDQTNSSLRGNRPRTGCAGGSRLPGASPLVRLYPD